MAKLVLSGIQLANSKLFRFRKGDINPVKSLERHREGFRGCSTGVIDLEAMKLREVYIIPIMKSSASTPSELTPKELIAASTILDVIPEGNFAYGPMTFKLDEEEFRRFTYSGQLPEAHAPYFEERYLLPYAIGKSLVTNAQYKIAMDAGLYKEREYWLEEGWKWKEQNHINKPNFWREIPNLAGTMDFMPVSAIREDRGCWLRLRDDPEYTAPVIGISWYEAGAFCKMMGYRLPTDNEWEKSPHDGNFGIWEFTSTLWREFLRGRSDLDTVILRNNVFPRFWRYMSLLPTSNSYSDRQSVDLFWGFRVVKDISFNKEDEIKVG